MLTVPQLLLWFTFFGLPVTSTAGAVGTDWLAGIRNDVAPFIDRFIIGRLTIVLGAYFVVRAVLDAAQDGHPLPSVFDRNVPAGYTDHIGSHVVVIFERPPIKQSNEELLLQITDSAAVDHPVLVPINFSKPLINEEEKNHE